MPIVSFRGISTGIPIFGARNRSKSRKNCCKLLHARFSPLLGGGLEPPRLTAYAPQTYVSAISPPERFGGTQLVSWTTGPASVSSGANKSQKSGVRNQGSGVTGGNTIAGNKLRASKLIVLVPLVVIDLGWCKAPSDPRYMRTKLRAFVAVPPHARSFCATNGGREQSRFLRYYFWVQNFTSCTLL